MSSCQSAFQWRTFTVFPNCPIHTKGCCATNGNWMETASRKFSTLKVVTFLVGSDHSTRNAIQVPLLTERTPSDRMEGPVSIGGVVTCGLSGTCTTGARFQVRDDGSVRGTVPAMDFDWRIASADATNERFSPVARTDRARRITMPYVRARGKFISISLSSSYVEIGGVSDDDLFVYWDPDNLVAAVIVSYGVCAGYFELGEYTLRGSEEL